MSDNINIRGQLSNIDADGVVNFTVFDNESSKTTCKIFKKVICCGDSYTAGYIDIRNSTDDEKTETNFLNSSEYSWPHYMSVLTGNNWINCGKSGASSETWQDPNSTKYCGIIDADTEHAGKAQAYVIGLLINDTGSSHHVDLGTRFDIGTGRNTYYANMSRLIRTLNSFNNKAKIFVNTCPKDNTNDRKYEDYNKALRYIVDVYKDQYPVHCIDLYKYRHMYNVPSIKSDFINGHYTAIGYEQFAEIYCTILSNYINNHIKDFQDVAFIEYD